MADVFLVAVTGWGRRRRRISREAGFDRHVVKPIAGDAILELVASVDPASRSRP